MFVNVQYERACVLHENHRVSMDLDRLVLLFFSEDFLSVTYQRSCVKLVHSHIM